VLASWDKQRLHLRVVVRRNEDSEAEELVARVQ